MTYILGGANVAASGVQGKLHLVTDGVQDPVARQNFEILNKYYAVSSALKNRPKANVNFSPQNANKLVTTGPTVTTVQTPSDLQSRMTSYGNPIRVKLGAAFYGQAYPAILAIGGAAPSIEGTFGWYRDNKVVWNCNLHWSLPGVSGYVFPIPLPAFEFDDVVPAGSYTYQFYYQLVTAATNILYRNLNVVAYELR
jgi:hypothetical protein